MAKILVEAIRLGYYGNKRVREGQMFYVASEKEFSATWMKEISQEGAKKVEPKKQVKKDIVSFDDEKTEDVVI